MNDLIKDIKKKFPSMDSKVLSDIAGWDMYWEYLRQMLATQSIQLAPHPNSVGSSG
jgi:hypothetical protein